MNSTAILLLFAGVLSVEGEVARIDAGRSAGLRVGDRGLVFYELKVRDETRRVEVGDARVVAVEELSASIDVADAAQVRPGYRVEFSIPAARLAEPPPAREPPAVSPETAELRRRLTTAEARIAELEGEVGVGSERLAELERTAAESGDRARAATEKIADLERSLSAARDEARLATERAAALDESLAEARSSSAATGERAADAERSRSESAASLRETRARLDAALAEQERLRSENRAALAAAEGRIALLAAELEAARAAAAAQTAPPSPASGPAEGTGVDVSASSQAEPAPAAGGEMAHLAGGEYEMGREPAQASYYNQTPRFMVRLAPYWVDLLPVESSAYEAWRGSAPVATASRYQMGITLAEAEAYCRAHGKRLPTEAEWEVAMTVGGLDGVASLLEWTSSWYQPYPGNDHPEADYGERFRVVRGSGGDRYERRYMLPQARDSAVGFRCVRARSESP